MKNLLLFDEKQDFTLGQFRELTKDLPDDMPIGLRFTDPQALGDDEPSVVLDGLAVDDAADEPLPLLGLLVSLKYLDEYDDTEAAG